MLFQRQNAKDLIHPSDNQIARQLRFLKSYGRSAYASLTDAQGNWVQVGGGRATCVVEYKNAETGRIFRAFQEQPVIPLEFDGAVLSFAGSQLRLSQNEWFTIEQVIEVFLAFRHQQPFPEIVHWRDITDQITK
ncbi:MAG: hypothetical protein HY774_06355 [Acidobacteria bacterium]|nr:hypothetical protein [Acidobacteriota bacterium]